MQSTQALAGLAITVGLRTPRRKSQGRVIPPGNGHTPEPRLLARTRMVSPSPMEITVALTLWP